MPPRKTQGRDPDATRAKLLGAAQKEFNTKGFFGTDTNRIARRAGFAPQTFYRHFEDKIAIFLAVYAQWWQGESAQLAGALSRRAGAGEAARIVAEFHTHWKVFRRSLRHLAIVEPRVRAARTQARLSQIERLNANAAKRRAAPVMIAALLAAERICDALADGELSDLGLSRKAALELVKNSMAELTGVSGGA